MCVGEGGEGGRELIGGEEKQVKKENIYKMPRIADANCLWFVKSSSNS